MVTASSCSVGHGVLQRWLTSFTEVPDCELWGWREWRMVSQLFAATLLRLCSLCSVYWSLLAAVTNRYTFSKQH